MEVIYHISDSVEEKESVYVGTPVKLKDAQIKENYTFLGWTTIAEKNIDTAEGIDLGRMYKAGEEINLYEDLDLYPVWLSNSLKDTYFVVLYRPNGGDDSAILKTAFLEKKDESHQIISETPIRTGYEFAGWKIDGDTDETIYMHEGDHAAYTVTGDVTFIAQWTPNKTFVVTYDAKIRPLSRPSPAPPAEAAVVVAAAERIRSRIRTRSRSHRTTPGSPRC